VARINWTSEAELWLRDIFEYISKDNPAAASDVVNGIYEKAQILRNFPEIGYSYKKESTKNVRILLYGHYRIAYLIKPNNDIDVLGVFHGAMNIQRYLF